MENLELVYSFFNQYMYNEAMLNLALIEHYIHTNPATAGNKLILELINSLKTYPFESLDIPLFQSITSRLGATPKEADLIIGNIIKWKKFTREQILPARKYLRDLCSSELIKRAKNLYKDDPTEYIRYIQSLEIPSMDYQDTLKSYTFGQFDINSIREELLTDGIESSFPWLNQSYQPLGKVPRGQIIMVVAAPGVGKTLFCMNEALYMAWHGHRVHYLAMGDMRQGDFIQRMCTIYSGLSFGEATKNIDRLYGELCDGLNDNFEAAIVPSDCINVDRYIDKMLKSDYDVCFIDYDSNFNQDGMGKDDSMFRYYGKLYASLTKLTAAGKLVYICAQPKSGTYELDVFTESTAGESRRKIETADVMIGISRYANSPNNIGKISIAKNRRGEVNLIYPYIRLGNGRFKVLPREVYENIKVITEKRNYTEGELNMMIQNNTINKQIIQNSIQQPSQPKTKVNPFKK